VRKGPLFPLVFIAIFGYGYLINLFRTTTSPSYTRSVNLKGILFMTNVRRTLLMTTLLLLTSGLGCASSPQKTDVPPREAGPVEMLKRLTTPMHPPSEPRQGGIPPTAIPASSPMRGGGPAGYYEYLLALMEAPVVKSEAVTQRVLVPAPTATEEPSRGKSVPSHEPPLADPSTPPATARPPVPPPAIIEEVTQTPPQAVLPLPAKEETWSLELAPPPASRMEIAAINRDMQTPPSLDSPRSKEEQLSEKKSYRIGPEDVIRVSVWEYPELTMDLTVKPDGKISLPLINEIHAADLTPIELSDVIAQDLKKYMKDPYVTVIVTQANFRKIYLIGNVLRPGAYPLRQDMTVLQALSLAGGFTTFASPREMKLISGTGTKQEIRKINYYKMIEDIELGHYILKAGDTIVIP